MLQDRLPAAALSAAGDLRLAEQNVALGAALKAQKRRWVKCRAGRRGERPRNAEFSQTENERLVKCVIELPRAPSPSLLAGGRETIGQLLVVQNGAASRRA